MSSSNLALVFGPTLVHAPPEFDPIQLHNDVPAVNLLIQICIEQHHVIFVKIDSPPPPPLKLENEPRVVVTPPPEIGHEVGNIQLAVLYFRNTLRQCWSDLMNSCPYLYSINKGSSEPIDKQLSKAFY